MRLSQSALDAAIAPVLDRVLTPALVVDLDAVDHNVRTMIQVAGGAQRWRPHVKTVKQGAVLEILAQHEVHASKCATLTELALILQTYAHLNRLAQVDVLLAYPLSPPALASLATLKATYDAAQISVLADDPEHLLVLNEGCGRHGIERLSVYLDVDLGMHRTGCTVERWQQALAGPSKRSRFTLPHLHIVGVHGYDGHLGVHHRHQAFSGYRQLCGLMRALDWSHLLRPPTLLTAGTHTFAHALACEELWHGAWHSQITPGTVVFSDLRSQAAVAGLGLHYAAYVLTRVVSMAHEGITVDAGTKALAPDVIDHRCEVAFYPDWQAGAASEEHLRLHKPTPDANGRDVAWQRGDHLWLLPSHVCTTVNLHQRALYLRGGQVVGEGSVAAGHPLWSLTASPMPSLDPTR